MKPCSLLAISLCALPCVGFAASLDLRPGNWDVVMATTVVGLPMPQETLARMSPGERAEFDAAMKARAGKVNRTSMQTCVTKDDLERGDLMKSDRANCARKVIEQTARRFEVEESCAAPDALTTHMTFDAKSPETYTATIERSQDDGGKVHIELTGRWMGAKCSREADD